MQVSVDEMNSWFHKNWLSFDPSATTEYSERERIEVLFVRGLARSGLSDAMVSRIFSAGLERRYCYDSDTTFFSFVQNRCISIPPERDPAAAVWSNTVGNGAIGSCLHSRTTLIDWSGLPNVLLRGLRRAGSARELGSSVKVPLLWVAAKSDRCRACQVGFGRGNAARL
jgi:hypothetical protein